jgi:two-component system invasion response regulator UvrY
MAIPLFLIEDEELVCELLGEFLKGEEDIEFLGEARDGASAIVKCRELKPEMIILDLRLPEISGLDVLKIIHKELPHSKVIIFTGSLSEETLQSTLQNGAIAYVEKAYGLEELKKALEAAKKGEKYFSPSIARLVEDYQF